MDRFDPNLELDFTYKDEAPAKDEEYSTPPYDQILEWMSLAESPSLLFDNWSRGNFIRHSFSSRIDEAPSIIVPFTYLDELRCYHRRLALMGIGATFVYLGDLPAPKKFMSLTPSGDNYDLSGGAGWTTPMLAEHDMVRRRGRNWLPTFGCARPMPEVFAEWLLTEGRSSFQRGELYVAPAELIGIPKDFVETGLNAIADVHDSKVIPPKVQGAEFLLNLDLPYVDHMPHETFLKLIQDEELQIQRFRYAIKKLVKGEFDDVNEAIEEVRYEVAEMTLSDGHAKFRQNVSRFGGAITSFGVGLSAFGAATGAGMAALESLTPAVIGAAAAGGTAVLVELWKQGIVRRQNTKTNPYSIFWDLGVKAPSQLKRRSQILRPKPYNQAAPLLLKENYNCHWLAKPGMQGFLFVQPK